MTKSIDLQKDLERLRKCHSEIENDISQMEAVPKPNFIQIAQKGKEKFDILVLIEIVEKKLCEVQTHEGTKPLSEAQKRKREEFIKKNESYGIVRASYLGYGDN